MKRPTLHRRNLFWLVLVAGFAGAILVWLGGTLVHRSASYEVAAEFQQLPDSDEGLTQWLKQQPGIIPNTVRVKRDGSRVRVSFMQSQNLFHQPPFPDLESAATQLGYAPADKQFRDVPR